MPPAPAQLLPMAVANPNRSRLAGEALKASMSIGVKMYRDGPESAEPDAVAPESLAPLAAAGTTEPDPNRCSLMVLTVAIYEPLMDERCRWVWGQGSRAMCEVRRSTHCTLHKHCDMVERWVVKRKTSGPKFPIWGTMVDSRSCISLAFLHFLSASFDHRIHRIVHESGLLSS